MSTLRREFIGAALAAGVVAVHPQEPDPHGMCIHEGHMYYCDAGLTEASPGSAPSYICRFPL